MSQRFARIPGLTVGFSQPMIDGVNDKVSGAHSELVLKIYGSDLPGVRRIAEQAVSALQGIPGAVDVAIDQEPPLPQLQVSIDRAAAARYGINVANIAELIEVGIGGRAIAQLFLGERRYDIAVRFVQSARSSPEAIGNLTLTTPANTRVPLAQVAQVSLRSGESTITREMNHRHLTVKLNLRGRPLSAFLSDAEDELENLSFDRSQYTLAWGGQFENQNRAQRRLAIIVPAALALIFLLLYGAFGTLRHPALILVNVPLALLGGLIALMLRGMTLNVSSAVGFIALFGVAVQNGVIMVSNLNRHRDLGGPLSEAVRRGARERLRPVLMTATVATLGLIPAALARGIGSDVQRPLATVVVGGLITATALTLLILPILYGVVERRFTGRPA
jgi:cobalt-zinc-cadmium resistance protein CzcA